MDIKRGPSGPVRPPAYRHQDPRRDNIPYEQRFAALHQAHPQAPRQQVASEPYTAPQAAPETAPHDESPNPYHAPSEMPARKIRGWVLPALGVIAVIAALAGMAIVGHSFAKKHGAVTPIPKSVSAAADFPLYYPGKLPQGWALEEKSFVYTPDNIAAYTVSANGGGKVFMSIQKPPAGFNFERQIGARMTARREVPTPYGKAAMGTLGTSRIVSLETSGVWIQMAGTMAVDEQELAAFAGGLKESPE